MGVKLVDDSEVLAKKMPCEMKRDKIMNIFELELECKIVILIQNGGVISLHPYTSQSLNMRKLHL